MKKTYLQRAASALMGAMLLAGILGTPAAAVQKQVDAYGRDFTRVEGGTYFSERTGESTYRERIHTYVCPENNGGKHILEYHKEAPTCTEGDYNAYYCVLCGERELNVEFPALGHAYTDTVTTPATKETPGVRTYTCSRCGDTYTEEIPPLESGTEEDAGSAESQEPGGEEADSCPHNTWYYDTETATCTREGRWLRTCKSCGKVEVLKTTAKLSHAYTSNVTVPATEEAAGVRTYTCTRCGDTYTEEIPRLNGAAGSGTQEGSCTEHTWRYESVPATCTEDGKYERTCLQCGACEVTKVLPALGHHDVVQQVIRPATVEQEGEQLCRCSRCGDVHTVAIPRLEESPAAAATGLRDSGSTELEKLSQSEIEELLEQAPLRYEGNMFVQTPSARVPFSSGTVEKDALQAAADRLNALRRIAGLPAVELDMELSRSAQYGAVIQAAQGGLNHYPDQLPGMSDDFYKEARSASSTSNLSAGRTLVGSVDGWMDDSDASNIDGVGHRRWQLNPVLGKVGFGFALGEGGYGAYAAEKVMDKSGSGCAYDFVSRPASGNFPEELMDGRTAWSVTLNPELYADANKALVTVTLTREEDGRTWTFQSGSSDGFFSVSNAGYGTGCCIIFRPDGVETYDGTYTVQIQGLRARNGQNVPDFTYEVTSFGGQQAENDARPEQPAVPGQENTVPGQAGQEQPGESAQEPQQPEQTHTFRDVPTAHWAHGAITRAADAGIVNGYADGTFHPAATVTNAHFDAMLARAFFPEELGRYGGAWWQPGTFVCRDQGILTGTAMERGYLDSGSWEGVLNTPITRLDMAQMLYRLLAALEVELPDAQTLEAAQCAVGDWEAIPESYRQAVSVCYALGLLNGQADGTFGGSNCMNRAQGCTVIVRMADYLAAQA